MHRREQQRIDFLLRAMCAPTKPMIRGAAEAVKERQRDPAAALGEYRGLWPTERPPRFEPIADGRRATARPRLNRLVTVGRPASPPFEPIRDGGRANARPRLNRLVTVGRAN